MPSKIVYLTVPKISVVESFNVSEFSIPKKFGSEGGGLSRFSVENFLCQSAENFRRGEFFSVSLISVIEKNLLQRLMSRFSIFCRCFFVSQCREIS